ncbi:MAG: sugar phosphate isomerase/epimerase [Bacteroidetes bacterium]|nr:sugar phosphate isomerase/epimerase [Bacteroidota bacterium]
MKRVFHLLLTGTMAYWLLACNGSSSGASSAADSADLTKDWTLSVQLWTFHIFDFNTAIEKADSAGLQTVEAFPGQKLVGYPDTAFGAGMSAASRQQVKAFLAQKKISILAYGVVVPQTAGEWVSNFEFAKDMGIRYITTEPLKEHWDLVDSLSGAYDIPIAIHDHPKPSPYWHPDSVLAAAAGRPHIGACADIGHWVRNGLKASECVHKLQGKIVGLHLKDVKVFGQTDAADMIPGTGVVDIPAVLAELKRQGFKGNFSIEHEDNWDNNVPDVKQIVTYFNEQVKALQSSKPE